MTIPYLIGKDLPRPGKVLRYASPSAYADATARLGMIVFLAAWMMLFAALFFVYGGLRTREAVWPPLDTPTLPVGPALFNTVLVVLASGAVLAALRSAQAGRRRRLLGALVAATLLGAGFLASQARLWLELQASGLSPGSGAYGSVFFGLTWIHAAHVLVGVLALAVLTVSAGRGQVTPARHLSLRLWGTYWHFVGAVWGVMFVTLFLV